MRLSQSKAILLFIVLFIISIIRCGGVNRLREYDLRDQSAVAIMAPAPRAQVFSETHDPAGEKDLLSTAINIGTTIAKGVEAHKAQERLDRAMEQVDIPEEIRMETFSRCTEYLYMQEATEAKTADFVYMMKIKEYGISAQSWDSNVDFKINMEIRLIDNSTHQEVWVKKFNETQPVTNEIFGIHESAHNIITAVALSELSEDEMITGFQNLAAFVSGRIAEKIHKDYLKAHSKN